MTRDATQSPAYEGLQGHEDKGVEDIPGTNAFVHTAANMMFSQLNINVQTPQNRWWPTKPIRCLWYFYPLCSKQKECTQLAFYHCSTTRWSSFGPTSVASMAAANVLSSFDGDPHVVSKFSWEFYPRDFKPWLVVGLVITT